MTFLRHGQISVLVAVAILEEFCMASADKQLLFYSGERTVANGPLVYKFYCSELMLKFSMFSLWEKKIYDLTVVAFLLNP